MQPKLEEYPEMVSDLAQGGFTAKQSESLVTLVARMFSRQDEHFERIRKEDREDRESIRKQNLEEHEQTRREFRESLLRLEAKVDTLFSQMSRWVITTLTTLALSMLGAVIIYVLRALG